ncbi:telomere repeat-binding protein 1 [Striga asiatica]|uniref:Telomere repeat-binding protein 1 n=1 Tax=Striga asiatica TaxID=4170 RepID=A0A5A7PSJ5_STRAF|nr:telomere repeat-binding protein 1 [Striga asiatica]
MVQTRKDHMIPISLPRGGILDRLCPIEEQVFRQLLSIAGVYWASTEGPVTHEIIVFLLLQMLLNFLAMVGFLRFLFLRLVFKAFPLSKLDGCWMCLEFIVLGSLYSQKRLDYGFHGYQLPPTPRAARSVRRRGLFKRKADDQQMCAFDLLATVAGKLLLDGENCPPPASSSPAKERAPVVEDSNTITKQEKDEDKALEEKATDRDSYERNFLLTELVSEVPNPNNLACAQNGVKTSDCVGPTAHLVNDDCKLRLGIFTPVDVESSGFRLSSNCVAEDESKKKVKIESVNDRNLSIISEKAFPYSSGHVENSDKKSSALICSVNNVKFPFPKGQSPCGSFPVHRDTVKLVSRDDDENSCECTEPSTRNKAIQPSQCLGDGRFRKLLPAKHCRITSNGDEEHYTGESSSCPSKDSGVKWQRSLRDYPFKKRKLYGCGSVPNSDEGIINTDQTCQVPESGTIGDGLVSSGLNQPGGTPPPISVPGGHMSLHSRNSKVKLKIKSFRVPELLVEIPETATVGSLKRRVLEAVNSVLGGGLRVGVLLQGKRIRDDNKTLAQTGISLDKKMDLLGFSLEPTSNPAPIRLYPEDRPNEMLCQSPQPLRRYPPTPRPTQSSGGQQHRLNGTINFNHFMESDHNSGPSKTSCESKALVPLTVPSSIKQDALAVVPLRKSKRSESAQRRIRRPFTVAEVEALVQAVEKLGTGRWRDVKLRAFDSAKHRTYVDLKDKWKTLVHTARISPQQRRGEPVPQELLDRVLTAHAYWSQQQAKQQLKSQPDTCLLL